MIVSDDFERHQRYLAEVPPEVNERRLKSYRLPSDAFSVALPPICQELVIDVAEQHQFLHPLDPVTLDDLKKWFGLPNEIAHQQLKRSTRLAGCDPCSTLFARVEPENLPRDESFVFGELKPKQQVAVKQMARSLLYSYVPEEATERADVRGVVNYMLGRMAQLENYAVVIPDLIVCPDNTVEINNVPKAVFNNILIYGNGQIKTNSTLSIDAFQIRHINI